VSASGTVSDAEQVDTVVSPDGWFHIVQGVSYHESIQRKNGRFIAGERLEDYLFTIRAAGCDDYSVHYRPDDPDRVIIMNCPGRTQGEDHESQ
jgi:hypothetical protein